MEHSARAALAEGKVGLRRSDASSQAELEVSITILSVLTPPAALPASIGDIGARAPRRRTRLLVLLRWLMLLVGRVRARRAETRTLLGGRGRFGRFRGNGRLALFFGLGPFPTHRSSAAPRLVPGVEIHPQLLEWPLGTPDFLVFVLVAG